MMSTSKVDRHDVAIEHLSLTDEDVDVLHRIITRAEEEHDVEKRPFRALFAAYDSVLKETSLEEGREQTYFRFLLQIGNATQTHDDRQSLYDRFEALLGSLGIQLAYPDPEAGVDDIDIDGDGGGDGGGGNDDDDSENEIENTRSIGLRNLLSLWMERAKRHRDYYNRLLETAIDRDSKTLKRQALDLWRARLQRKRHEARSERFYMRLEQRVARARDLFLVTKAFTHWLALASSESKRTNDARQHVLAIKYFNAWREITAVNELKIQTFTTKKPFQQWLERLRRVRSDEKQAVAKHDYVLRQRGWQSLFWAYCEERVPMWRDFRLKQKSLLLWIRALRTNRERDHEIDAQNKYMAIHVTFLSMKRRHEAIVDSEKQADDLRNRKLLQNVMLNWHIRARYGHAAMRVANTVKTNIISAAFSTWETQSRKSQHARNIDRIRLLRNTWTTWNDKLRIRAMGQRIDERIVLQTFYRWIMIVRELKMTDQYEHRLKRDCFEKIVLRTNDTYNILLDLEEDFRIHQKHKVLSAKLVKWKQGLDILRGRDIIAFEFYAPRLQQDTFLLWRKRMEPIRQMEADADRARSYFLMLHHIKRWDRAAKEASKKHRLEAYATYRRNYKRNLAVKVLDTWSMKADHISQLQIQALEFRNDTLLKGSAEHIFRWAQLATKNVQMAKEADLYYRGQLLYKRMADLAKALTIWRSMEETATSFNQNHTARVAAAQVRKISLRLFQHRSNVDLADRQRERSFKKYAKVLLRYWVERTREKLVPFEPPEPQQTPQHPASASASTSASASASASASISASGSESAPSSANAVPEASSRTSRGHERLLSFDIQSQNTDLVNTELADNTVSSTPRSAYGAFPRWTRDTPTLQIDEYSNAESDGTATIIPSPPRSTHTPSSSRFRAPTPSINGTSSALRHRTPSVRNPTPSAHHPATPGNFSKSLPNGYSSNHNHNHNHTPLFRSNNNTSKNKNNNNTFTPPLPGETPILHNSSTTIPSTPDLSSSVLNDTSTATPRASASSRSARIRALTTDISRTPATPATTPFAARLMSQLNGGERKVPPSTGPRASSSRLSSRRRGEHGKRGSSLTNVVRFADEENGAGSGDGEEDPEYGSPSKGRAIHSKSR